MSTDERFGTFFRSKRKALGLTQREFCRRNGFDAGNISRLERGLTPPPQTQQGLESYAKALKLRRGTTAFDRFIELAATETMEKLPSLLRPHRTGGQRHVNWVKAKDLEDWARSLPARGTLPQMVRRLVWATGKDIKRIEFPAGEQVQRPGWDGIVEAAGSDAFVPSGTSGWEMGVDDDPKAKAEADYKKRTQNSLGLDKSLTSFVFVTPRKWQEKEKWRQAKLKLGHWKEVRVYDSASLEEWLERAPAVDVWLAEILGRKPKGLTSVDEYWANLEALTNPSLKPEVFFASRKQEVEVLRKWLESPPGAMLIETKSPTDAIDFVAAYCRSREPSQPGQFAARTLIVETRDAWRSIAASSDTELLLIANSSLPVEPEMVAEAVRHGHRVLLASSQKPSDQVSSIQLPRAFRYELEQALASCGLEPNKANQVARESGGSLTVLKRLLGRFPATVRPEWSEPLNAAKLVPILLAGSWEEEREGDRLALEGLSGRSYSDISELANKWLHVADSPVTQVMSRWSLLSREDSWFLLSGRISQDQFERFEQVVLDVLGENDPAYELPPDKRLRAIFHKKVLTYSQSLRTGLAETLALLGSRREGTSQLPCLASRVEWVVRKLLHDQDGIRWASLSPQLPLMAEAGPEAFLNAVDKDLKKKKPATSELFEQEGDSLFSLNPHTGLVWALEILSWERSYLSRASGFLARLAEIDPGARRACCPMKSLETIFRPWLPLTKAPVEDRIRILKKLIEKCPVIGWRLLIDLLPNPRPFVLSFQRPLWREWSSGWTDRVSNAECWRQVVESARLLIEHMRKDWDRWKELINQFDNLPEPVREEFLNRLKGLDVTEFDHEARQSIANAVREKLLLHQQYSQAKWALPGAMLNELEQVRRRFEPQDSVDRNAWLFGPYWSVWHKLGDQNSDLSMRSEHFEKLRRDALQAVIDQSGWEGILRLADLAGAPEEVGIVLGRAGAKENEKRILPSLLISGNEKEIYFACGYASGRFQSEGLDWVGKLKMKRWSAQEIARLLIALPFERRAWDLVTAQGSDVSSLYWTKTPAFLRDGDTSDFAFAASRLLEHKRPSAALAVLGLAILKKAAIEPSLCMDALEAWRDRQAHNRDQRMGPNVSYSILPLVEELQNGVKRRDARIDVNRLGRLEWAYFRMLDGHHRSTETLHAMLRDAPEHFVELLSFAFPSKIEPKESQKVVLEGDQVRELNAFHLLKSWDKVPGTREDGTVDEDRLQDWIKKASALAEERGLLDICDSQIGEVFAHAPAEPDGSWPCVAVRDALEEIDRENVFNGFLAGIFNLRGLHWKSLGDGGVQERELAKKYRVFAEASQIDWPKTAAALRRVAQSYDDEAGREDARTKLD
jgi:transcriptional regulator with XRE-family HTH domain